MNYEKSAGAVVISGNALLLVKHNKGHWSFPKGHLENGETEEEAAVREVSEETGLDISIISDLRYVVTYSPFEGTIKDVVYFKAYYVGGTLRPLKSEISDVKWVNFETARKLITYNNDRNVFFELTGEN